MFVDPLSLIDETIDHLEMLAEMFADETDARLRQPPGASMAMRTCRDAQIAITTLLPKLRAARATQEPRHAPNQLPFCLNCD
jgi:hypothetical protein